VLAVSKILLIFVLLFIISVEIYVFLDKKMLTYPDIISAAVLSAINLFYFNYDSNKKLKTKKT
jgi:hypothetical protein